MLSELNVLFANLVAPLQENVMKLLFDPPVNQKILEINQNLLELISHIQNSEVSDKIQSLTENNM